jgi:hypothetical protein
VTLTEANAAWIRHGDRVGVGVSFDAPNGGGRISVFFANPIDGGQSCGPTQPPYEKKWTRTGNTFADLSLTPSVDAFEAELDGRGQPTGRRVRTIWHGIVANGKLT